MKPREAARWILEHHDTTLPTKDSEAMRQAVRALANIKEEAAETEPRRWIEQGDFYGYYYDCPACGEGITEGPNGETPEQAGWHYCPYCGAYIEGVQEAETDDEEEDEQ